LKNLLAISRLNDIIFLENYLKAGDFCMKKSIVMLLIVAVMITMVFAGCAGKTDDLLSTIDREAPYTAQLPSVITSIEPDEPDEVEVLIGTVSGATGAVNVRSEPSINGIVIGSVMPGEKYLVTEEFAAEEWHKVKYNGSVGFVHANYLTVTTGTMDMLDAGNQGDAEPDVE